MKINAFDGFCEDKPAIEIDNKIVILDDLGRSMYSISLNIDGSLSIVGNGSAGKSCSMAVELSASNSITLHPIYSDGTVCFTDKFKINKKGE